MALDLARAREEIRILAVEARERAIDRSQYATVRERVKKACQSWKAPLVGLAAIALYNTAGVVILVLNDGIISGSTIMNDVLFAAIMGKETCLLFIFLGLATIINDSADDLATDIYQWELSSDGRSSRERYLREGSGRGSESSSSGGADEEGRSGSGRRSIEDVVGGILEAQRRLEVLAEGG